MNCESCQYYFLTILNEKICILGYDLSDDCPDYLPEEGLDEWRVTHGFNRSPGWNSKFAILDIALRGPFLYFWSDHVNFFEVLIWVCIGTLALTMIVKATIKISLWFLILPGSHRFYLARFVIALISPGTGSSNIKTVISSLKT